MVEKNGSEERALVKVTKTELARPMEGMGMAQKILRAAAGELEKAVAGALDPVYVARVALTALQRNPKLLRCTGQSFVAALLEGLEFGLVPDSVLGQAYLVPYKDTCNFQIGYRGLIALARRSGMIDNIGAEAVREGDEFDYSLGTDAWVRHKPAKEFNPNAKVTHIYATAWPKGSPRPTFKVWTWEQVIAHAKKYSQAYRQGKKDSPWFTAPVSMAKKTVLRDVCKLLADSPALSKAAVMDEYHEAGISTGPAAPQRISASSFGFTGGRTVEAEEVPTERSAPRDEPPEDDPNEMPPDSEIDF